MTDYPKIIASCSIRAATHGDSHGGLYVLDLNTNKFEKVLDWSIDIDFNGRGAERGLRGIALYKDQVIVAGSSNLLFLDKDFNIVKNKSNPCLRYCHEICVQGTTLWMLSTAYDVVLGYNLETDRFDKGFQITKQQLEYFDPNKKEFGDPRDRMHLNSISTIGDEIYISGVGVALLFKFKYGDKKLTRCANIPNGTHNARLLGPHVVINNTPDGRIELRDRDGKMLRSVSVTRVPKPQMKNVGLGDRIAKQPFARGLAFTDKYMIGGSSPGMISLYDRHTFKLIKNVIMNNDMRCTIHGLEVLK